jgi:hypothetical protein
MKPIGSLEATYGNLRFSNILDEKYEVYLSTMHTNGFAELKSNLQAFLKILIDGAQFPCESIYWTYFILYEKINGCN